MATRVTFQRLVDILPTLSLRPGKDRQFVVTDRTRIGKEEAGVLSDLAERYSLFAFPPRENKVTIYRPKKQPSDGSIRVTSIRLD